MRMRTQPTIIMDTRERMSGLRELLTSLGINVKLMQLTVGDYVISEDIIVERKKAKDFVTSVFDGRLFEQARRLASVCSLPTLIVESSISDAIQDRSNPLAVWGALASVSYSIGLHIFYTSNEEETAQLLATLARHGGYGRENGPVVRVKKRMGEIWEKQLAIVCSIPGIGCKTGLKLLEELKTVRAVISSSPLQISRVAGIPYRKAVKIVGLLNEPFNPSPEKVQSIIRVKDEEG